MKRLEDIENMELDELIAEAERNCTVVPEDLENGIRSRISRHRRVKMDRIRYGAAAAIAALMACSALVGLTLSSRMPKDTFDDPELAYAEVQRAFGMISDALNTGASEASMGQARFANTTNQINDILK